MLRTLWILRFQLAISLLAGLALALGLIEPASAAGAPLLAMAMAQQFPDVNTFKANLVTKNPGSEWEVIKQSLYDSAVYPTAGVALLNFFQTPIGGANSASSGNAGNAKVLGDTNMTQAGILPAPQMFFVQSLEVDFQAGSSAAANAFVIAPAFQSAAAPAAATGVAPGQSVNDVNVFYTGGALRFTVGPKPYLEEAPLYRFPPKCRFELDGALGGNSATTANFGALKLKSGGRPYQLDPGLAIFSMQNFGIQLLWPVVVATPSGFNGRVQVTLDGWLFRAIQ